MPLIAATYFMVSGGPYGIEDILGGAGFGARHRHPARAAASLVPAHRADDRRARQRHPRRRRLLRLGAPRARARSGDTRKAGSRSPPASSTWRIYPSIFVLYLGKFSPALTAGWRGYAWSLAVVVMCCAWNLRGAPAVGEGSVGLFALLLAPFAVFVVLGFWHGFTAHPAVHWGARPSSPRPRLSTAILVAMWNYMGWDNASTVAQEVENPQRNYPRAMIAAAASSLHLHSSAAGNGACRPLG